MVLRIAFAVFFLTFCTLIVFVVRKMQIPSRLKKAQMLVDKGELSEANEIIREILARKDSYAPARYLKANILMIQSQYLLAIMEYNNILLIPDFNQFVNELDIHYRLAELYNLTHQYNKEILEFKKILTFNPDDIKANHRVGLALYNQKIYDQAVDHLLKAKELDPALPGCDMALGISLYNLGDYENAEVYLLSSLNELPNSAEINYHLGLIYKKKKDFDNALKMFEKTQSDSTFGQNSSYNLGEIYFSHGDYTNAIKSLDKGLSRIGNDEESLAYRYLLAESYEACNQISEAVFHWDKIYGIKPGYRNTQAKLEDYKGIMENENLRKLFTASLIELQPLISEIISRLNFNILSKEDINSNEILYKAFNIKRINEPPVIIYFNRTPRDINETQIADFQKTIQSRNCKTGIYVTTGKFSLKAKTTAKSKGIELLSGDELNRLLEKIKK